MYGAKAITFLMIFSSVLEINVVPQIVYSFFV